MTCRELVCHSQRQGWRRIAFIGASKHAGKTTALNAFVAAAADLGLSLGLTSIGFDGEATDALSGIGKPRIWAPAGTLVASADAALAASSARLEYLEELPISTPLGPVLVARVLADGYVVLAGVRRRRDVALALTVLTRHGSELMLVDGAFARIAAASPGLIDAVVVAVGAVLGGGPEQVAQQAMGFLQRFRLPETPDAWRLRLETAVERRCPAVWVAERLHVGHGRVDLPDLFAAHLDEVEQVGVFKQSGTGVVQAGGSDCPGIVRQQEIVRQVVRQPVQQVGLFTPGAPTDDILHGLLARWRQLSAQPSARSARDEVAGGRTEPILHLVAQHPAQVLASGEAMAAWLRAGHELSVWSGLPLAAIAVNPHHPFGEHLSSLALCRALQAGVPGVPVFDAAAGYAALRDESGTEGRFASDQD
ncbi:MAG: hypothetical protein K6T63_04815 [Alicyclobacillus herbarius]|uniref:lysine 5,6-aminomutase reactivase subunit KamB n=1 Tax=Alicyclobacillus herbarius TaxID=122960 RepID=UPI002355DCA6|nr:hypothetical protein [Alicyclobacillus herbarius]MCL6631937.1 hypothetical protein [Alicyclobacillus herbarius]